MNSVRSKNLSLKYQRFTPLSCKDIGIRIFEFVAKTQILLFVSGIVVNFLVLLFCNPFRFRSLTDSSVNFRKPPFLLPSSTWKTFFHLNGFNGRYFRKKCQAF